MHVALRGFRNQKGLTQQEISNLMGIKKVKYVKTELGYQKPDTEFVERLLRAFNLTLEETWAILFGQGVSAIETQPPDPNPNPKAVNE